MLNEVIILFVTSAATYFGGWLFGRRKKRAEAAAAEIGNLDRIIQMWQNTAEQFKRAHDELRERNVCILDELKVLHDENKVLALEVKRLSRLVEELKCENKGLIRRLNEIKRHQEQQDETRHELKQ